MCSVNHSIISSRDEGQREENRTSISEISDRMSITSRAACRLDANSTLGILAVGGLGLIDVLCLGWWVFVICIVLPSLVLLVQLHWSPKFTLAHALR